VRIRGPQVLWLEDVGADSLSAKKVLDDAMKKLEKNPGR
jgi:hypothetical protein